jgi:hypothetical protein
MKTVELKTHSFLVYLANGMTVPAYSEDTFEPEYDELEDAVGCGKKLKLASFGYNGILDIGKDRYIPHHQIMAVEYKGCNVTQVLEVEYNNEIERWVIINED